MKQHIFIFLICLGTTLSGWAQTKVTISGYMRDGANGEGLIGATVQIKGQTTGTVTNEYGFYSLTIPQGNYTLVYQYIGYLSQEKAVTLQANQKIDIQLSADQVQIQEVVVTETRPDNNVRSMDMGVSKLEMKAIRSMPALLGEVDVVRSIQLLPGVSTVGEGASGFNVRGGGVDQNLILLDEAPVYNSSHLMGFFSVFNPDAVKDVKLIKGGIPAQYGGRLSSLLDVRMKEGNNKKFGLSGGIGTISSRLTVEGPIQKDKSSFIISGRRSYADMFLKLSSDEDLKNNQLYFYDLSAKVNFTLSPKDRLFVSGYFGKDAFKFEDASGNSGGFKMNWGNKTGTVRWNHLFSDRMFANFTAVYSDYDYQLGVLSGSQAFEWTSHIYNYSGKADFSYYLNARNTITFGISAIRYQFEPGKAIPKSEESIFNPLELAHQNSIEYAAYIDNEQQLTPQLSVQYGLRFSAYNYLGAMTVYDYVGENNEKKVPVNQRTYGKGESISFYTNPEPRFSLRYNLNERSSIKASYNRMAQYVHLISNTTAASPLDVWSPTTNNIKPELADQIAVGYFRNFKNNMFETSAEVFYKTMKNQIDYRDGAEVLLNQELEGDLLYGDGRAYGLELYVKKNSGKLTGWVSYTLSRSERKIDGLNMNKEGEAQWYAAKYDRTHILSAVGIYTFNKKWSFSSNFSYTTGVATTFPNARYEVEDGTLVVPHNTEGTRNNYRVPAYHRLDLSATLTPAKNEHRRWKSEWVFSIYNVYAKRNPFTVYFRQNDENNASKIQTEAVRLSIFGSILPSVTYNFKF
ncbi:TonB-dependent receptor [Xanthocytophaga agilis]|uniref:TonB-dependent receptor n=1 Tax=Xanthocytophaga agilis TaxID=3048010 RepID=A0AAE3RB33_9BACT|nr:TonB-dependent receptor [Xanthocytophaga agilis]MDJ1504789.1 TonB-dependent receptor [Xanthocytophaga agilis]